MTTRIFRVRVSGQFGDLAEPTRQFLTRSAPDHTPSSAAFGHEPNLTYSPSLDTFALRIEVRVDDDTGQGRDPAVVAAERAVLEAKTFLSVLSIPHRTLRTTSTELTSQPGSPCNQDESEEGRTASPYRGRPRHG